MQRLKSLLGRKSDSAPVPAPTNAVIPETAPYVRPPTPSLDRLDKLNLKLEERSEPTLDKWLVQLGYTVDHFETTWHKQQLERYGWTPQRGLTPIGNLSSLLQVLLENLEIADTDAAKQKQRDISTAWHSDEHNLAGDGLTVLDQLVTCITTEESRVEKLGITKMGDRTAGGLIGQVRVVTQSGNIMNAHDIVRIGDNHYLYWQHAKTVQKPLAAPPKPTVSPTPAPENQAGAVDTPSAASPSTVDLETQQAIKAEIMRFLRSDRTKAYEREQGDDAWWQFDDILLLVAKAEFDKKVGGLDLLKPIVQAALTELSKANEVIEKHDGYRAK